MDNMRLIQTVTVGAGGASDMEFTSIPQTYTDLCVLLSVRASANSELYATVNNSNSGYTNRIMQGNGATTSAGLYQTSRYFLGEANWSSFTANTFSSQYLYFSNYTSSLNKSLSTESVTENDAATAYSYYIGGIWGGTDPISSIKFTISSGTFDQHSTAYLYGISNTTAGAGGAKATGGYVTEDTNYFYHTFLSSGVFTPTQSLTTDYIIIAGGGAGGGEAYAGGGGAGGIVEGTNKTLTTTSYAVTVGGGGAGVSTAVVGNNGTDSSFNSVTAIGGGGGKDSASGVANSGGSGGGGGANRGTTNYGTSTQTSPAGHTGYGNRGGGSGSFPPQFNAGGGGGAGAVGGTGGTTVNARGTGGDGLNTWSSWASVTGTGVNGYFAGGGGGALNANVGYGIGTAGGAGGGGIAAEYNTTNVGNGVTNTGSGGGGGNGPQTSGAGGSGLVIIRYAK